MPTLERPSALLAGAAALAILTAAAAPAGAQVLAEHVKAGCKTELETYCSDVTPGENRLLACIYAHADELSGQCEKALYEAASALQRAINTMAYLADQCRTDIESKCAKIEPGEGRIAECLADHKDSLSQPCTQAIAEVGGK
jgi:hypothetical protein